jgi:hypothetical protein
MTVGQVNMIRSWFRQGRSAGVIRGIDVFQEEAGDLISLLGGNGMPVMGFGRNRGGFFMIDHRGDLIRSDPALEALLVEAERALAKRVAPSGC